MAGPRGQWSLVRLCDFWKKAVHDQRTPERGETGEQLV